MGYRRKRCTLGWNATLSMVWRGGGWAAQRAARANAPHLVAIVQAPSPVSHRRTSAIPKQAGEDGQGFVAPSAPAFKLWVSASTLRRAVPLGQLGLGTAKTDLAQGPRSGGRGQSSTVGSRVSPRIPATGWPGGIITAATTGRSSASASRAGVKRDEVSWRAPGCSPIWPTSATPEPRHPPGDDDALAAHRRRAAPDRGERRLHPPLHRHRVAGRHPSRYGPGAGEGVTRANWAAEATVQEARR